MFTSDYSAIIDIEIFQKIPKKILQLIFQYVDDGLFVMNYNKNYSIITKTLIYKQKNPPQYKSYTFNDNSVIAPMLSKLVLVIFNIQPKVTLYEKCFYNNDNIIVKSEYCYRSTKKVERNAKKNTICTYL
jgi:hypothetical protein